MSEDQNQAIISANNTETTVITSYAQVGDAIFSTCMTIAQNGEDGNSENVIARLIQNGFPPSVIAIMGEDFTTLLDQMIQACVTAKTLPRSAEAITNAAKDELLEFFQQHQTLGQALFNVRDDVMSHIRAVAAVIQHETITPNRDQLNKAFDSIAIMGLQGIFVLMNHVADIACQLIADEYSFNKPTFSQDAEGKWVITIYRKNFDAIPEDRPFHKAHYIKNFLEPHFPLVRFSTDIPKDDATAFKIIFWPKIEFIQHN